MRNYMLLIVIITLVGCVGGGSDNQAEDTTSVSQVVITEWADNRTPDSGFQPWYQDWMQRQFSGDSIPKSAQPGIVDLSLAISTTEEILTKITWTENTNGGKWQTMEETESKGTGCCIDMAIDIYMHLRNAGFADENIGISYLKKGDKAHATIVIFMDGKIKALDLSDRSDWILIQTWNVFDCWRHDRT